MTIHVRLNWKNLVLRTLGGLAIGAIIGYLATSYSWGFGYLAAIGMGLGCIYCMQILQAINEAYFYPGFDGLTRGKRLACQLLSSLASHILGWFIPVWIAGMIIGFSFFRPEVLICMSCVIILIIIIHSIKLIINFYRELTQKELIEEKLKTLAVQSELKALKAQINPHFLFNSLNTIASLINTDSQKAETDVERLAEIFRYALSASNKEFVTVKEELEFVDSYLEIEHDRFGDRLTITRDISPDIADTPIPGLILQPLVENSIKHGSTPQGEIKLYISGRRDGELVRLVIKDTGKGVPNSILTDNYNHGTGLKNVNERLKMVYGNGYGLSIEKNIPAGTKVTVSMPRGNK
jgi:two-component sensor histidine kinase